MISLKMFLLTLIFTITTSTQCTVKYTRHRSMVRYGDNNWILKNDDLIPTGIDRFTQGAAIGIDRCKVACAARPKCKAIAMGHPTRGTAAECWLAGEVNDQDNPLMPHGNWDMYDIEEVCEPEKTPCTLAETTFTIDETIDGNAGAMSYFAIVNVTSRMNHVFQQNSGTCSYKELWFGVHPSTRKLYVGMCGVGTSETVAALPDGVNAIAMKYHAYGELEIWANGAKMDLGASQINGRAFSSSSTFKSSCSDQIKVYNRALSQNELETMTGITSGPPLTYTVHPSGLCQTVDGKGAKSKYYGRDPNCEDRCNKESNCYGYSLSRQNYCLLWTQRDIKGGDYQWDGANCHIKVTQTPTMQPTAFPTLNPTSNPSLNPTSNPSLSPSSSPTLTPTTNPSKPPTAEDFIVKVEGFHGEPKEVLDSSKLQDQPEVDAEFFGFKYKWTPLTRRLLNRFYDVQDQGFGPEDNLEEQGFEEGEFA